MEQHQFDSSLGFEQPQKPKSHVSIFEKPVRYFSCDLPQDPTLQQTTNILKIALWKIQSMFLLLWSVKKRKKGMMKVVYFYVYF